MWEGLLPGRVINKVHNRGAKGEVINASSLPSQFTSSLTHSDSLSPLVRGWRLRANRESRCSLAALRASLPPREAFSLSVEPYLTSPCEGIGCPVPHQTPDR